MKKKLLITSSTFPRWENDNEPRFILDIAKALLVYYDVTVLAPISPGAKEYEILEGIKVVRYHYFPIAHFETLCAPGAIVQRIKEKKWRIFLIPFLGVSLYLYLAKHIKEYDLTIANWIIPQGVIHSLLKSKYILVCHGSDVTSFNKGIVRTLKKRALKKASSVIVVSEHLKKQVLKLVPTIDVHVNPLGCDTKKFSVDNTRKDYFAQFEKKIILFVGRLEEIKGVTYLINAMQFIRDAILVIVGDGTQKALLEEQAIKIDKTILFLGAKSHNELSEIFASADIFVMPSVTTKNGSQEGFGLVLVEAMASGLPVVASQCGGIVDIVRDGENGYLVEEKNSFQIADKVNTILENDELYKKMSKAARNSAEYYDYTNVAERYYDILKNI